MNMHSHPWWQFFMVTKGKVLSIVNNTEYLWLNDQCSLMIPEHMNHSFYAQTDCIITELKFLIEHQSIKNSLLSLSPFNDTMAPPVLQAIDSLIQEGLEQDLHYKQIVNLLLQQFLFLYLRHKNHQNQQDAGPSFPLTTATIPEPLWTGMSKHGDKRRPDVDAIIGYMKDHIDQDISLDLLSEAFGFTRSYLCDLFSTIVGISPMRYLTLLRIERSKQWLQSTNWSLKKISVLSGFNSPHHMWRIFQKETGHSPSKYRQLFFDTQEEDIHFFFRNESEWETRLRHEHDLQVSPDSSTRKSH